MNPRAKSTAHAAFHNRAAKGGYLMANVSLKCICHLVRLSERPDPLQSEAGTRRTPGTSSTLGPLIRHGLVEFDRPGQCYRITGKGREYLATLAKNGERLTPDYSAFDHGKEYTAKLQTA